MIHLGDITKIDGAKVPAVEVIIGGSPCQDLSVAGQREGLKGERSGLFMEQIRIVKEMRRKDIESGAVNPRPRYMVWENVPGAFSSNKGEDFRIVLEETARICDPTAVIPRPEGGRWTYSGAIMGDGWSIAWRVLDAQFWGVPQRRRRIALVADFGGATAPEILFERDGVPGNPPQSGEQGQAPTGRTETGVGASSPAGLAYCIQGNAIGRADTAGCGGRGWRKDKSYTLNTVDRSAVAVFENHSQDTRFKGPVDISQTVSSTFGMGGNNTPFVVNKETVASFKSKMGSKAGNIGYAEDLAPTLSATQIDASVIAPSGFSQAAYDKFNADDKTATLKAQGGSYGGGSETLIVDYQKNIGAICARDYKGISDQCVQQGKVVVDVPDNNGGHNYMMNVNGACMATQQGGAEIRTDDKAPTLTAAAGMSGNNQPVYANAEYTVRRLTPLECERLQGFPDGWTDIGDWTDSKGKKRKTSDAARYKALGNSIALPPWAWILERLNGYCTVHTMASLFDGIGGFPLIWETLNGKGSCLWASEIEEFPIAVTKRRFNGGCHAEA